MWKTHRQKLIIMSKDNNYSRTYMQYTMNLIIPICPVLGFQITSIEAFSGFSFFLVPAFGP